MPFTIKTDLEADLETYAKNFFDSNPSCKFDSSKKLFPQLCNLLHKLINKNPRKVFFSKKFRVPDDLRAGLDALVFKLENGEDVNPYLNKPSVDPKQQDGMLNHFGIHHFHLGTNLKGHFMERTGIIALVLIRNDIAFFIDAPLHGKDADPLVWSKQIYIQIIHDEKPELISMFKVNGTLMSDPLDDENLNILRKKNVNAFIQVNDGTHYMGPGFGTLASGESLITKLEYLKLMKVLEERFDSAKQLVLKNVTSSAKELVLRMVDFGGHTNALTVFFDVIQNGNKIAEISSEFIGNDQFHQKYSDLNVPIA
ncbi:hypothetical protein [Acinetobacter soli]|uniref:hypothetical protein n=1 Tax=Acinetobacter soli TaxID=487316 RepID=UPI00124F8A59|nr:hypothetical protein [Acinetobacter soli]